MALAKKCDICGKLYESYNERKDKVRVNGFMFLNIDTEGKYYVNDALDCCPECIESVKEHIRKLKGERNESSKPEM